MSEGQFDGLLQAALAPWDGLSYDSLRETHPETAAALAAAVAQGLAESDVRDFCAARGYSPKVGHWLAQAVQHLRRQTAASEDEGETAGRHAIRDGQPGRGARDIAIRDAVVFDSAALVTYLTDDGTADR